MLGQRLYDSEALGRRLGTEAADMGCSDGVELLEGGYPRLAPREGQTPRAKGVVHDAIDDLSQEQELSGFVQSMDVASIVEEVDGEVSQGDEVHWIGGTSEPGACLIYQRMHDWIR